MSYKLILIDKSHVGLIYFKNKLLSIVMEHNLYRINDIYLGKVSALLPSLDAAFITLNPKSKNGFISFDHINTSKSMGLWLCMLLIFFRIADSANRQSSIGFPRVNVPCLRFRFCLNLLPKPFT